MRRLSLSPLLVLVLLLPVLSGAAEENDPTKLFSGKARPADRRLTGAVRTLNDRDFFLKPPATLAEWKTRRQAVREQLLVALGLWPMPPKTPLKVGDEAPDFTLPSSDNKPVKLSDFRGKKVVVLAFFVAAFTGG